MLAVVDSSDVHVAVFYLFVLILYSMPNYRVGAYLFVWKRINSILLNILLYVCSYGACAFRGVWVKRNGGVLTH